MLDVIEKALKEGRKTLSEYESRQVIESAGVAVAVAALTKTKEEAIREAEQMGYPVAMKGCSAELSHKTEAGMVALNVNSAQDVAQVFDALTGKVKNLDGVLVEKMVRGSRELVIGLSQDSSFGPCVMFGLGGIFTEALKDVTFRVAPLTKQDALEMIDEIKTKKLLGEFRGSPAVDRNALAKALVGIGDLAIKYEAIAEIDINPLIVCGDKPVAVDALVVLK
ncbi:MAG TPA: acetate--CoA ligase family protein [Smithella sp.]|jgi:acetyl-CoA synthetase (ADP-forming)|nr:acetate--CoA ligase family protein [Smithella sp.]OQC53455.1 MAG: succinyl-CoA synthetase subunit beta [Deltaproteobacteria bacterium ADurb.Bin022]HNQ66100.1 acetate--CoA ligase family protein [Smithella sp.]HOE32075.1 acetate--CoA ligase family protein [Smithella sp.]HOG09277.1 acetate--CoA ligase family protein [Smithella sp.]